MAELSQIKAEHVARKDYESEWAWANALRDLKLRTVDERKPWLPQGKNEPDEFHTQRVALSEHAPQARLIAERVKGAVFAKPARRDMGDGRELPGRLAEFADSAMRDGRSLAELASEAVMLAVWKRWCVALIDRRAPGEALPEQPTAEDAQRAGIDKPYVVLYPPEDVLDWRISADGTLEYVKLRSPAYREGAEDVTEYREVSLDGIVVHKVYRGATEERVVSLPAVPLSGGLVAAKRLPVAVCQYDRVDAMEARGLLAGALRAELRAFRFLSDLAWDVYVHAHPTLKYWGKDPKDVKLGANWYVHLNPGDATGQGKEDAEYLAPPGVGFEAQFAALRDARADVLRQAGIDPTGAMSSADDNEADAASGVSVAWKFETSESNALKNVADMAADFEWDVLYAAALDMDEEAGDLQVAYPKDFSLKSAEAMLLRVDAAKRSVPGSPTLHQELAKRAASALLDNADPALLKKIEQEIESYTPPEPTFDDGGFPKRAADEELA